MCLSDQAFKSRLCHISLSFATPSMVILQQKRSHYKYLKNSSNVFLSYQFRLPNKPSVVVKNNEIAFKT